MLPESTRSKLHVSHSVCMLCAKLYACTDHTCIVSVCVWTCAALEWSDIASMLTSYTTSTAAQTASDDARHSVQHMLRRILCPHTPTGDASSSSTSVIVSYQTPEGWHSAVELPRSLVHIDKAPEPWTLHKAHDTALAVSKVGHSAYV